MFDRSKTLTELEDDDWGKPGYPSALVIGCHEMRDKPVQELTDGEVRMAIGQQISLPILMPLALERLEQNPLLEADFYEGDLLKFVLLAKPEFWVAHPLLWGRADQIAKSVWSSANTMYNTWHETVEPELRKAYATFLEHKPR